MAQKITKSNLERVCERINTMTKSPAEPMTWNGDNMTHHVGNFHLCEQYGGTCLLRVSNTEGGTSDVLRIGYVSRRELYNAMFAFIEGINFGRENAQ